MDKNKVGFSNSQMFNYVMSQEEVCRALLTRVLGLEIERVDYVTTEYGIDPSVEGRGVRLDAYVRGAGSAFDVEMQSQQEFWLGLRFRYYQAAIDIDLLKKGADYSELVACYIIFLCKNDPFGYGLPVYTVEPTCQEDADVPVASRMRWIVLNCGAWERERDDAMRSLLQYVAEGVVDESDSLVLMIDEVVTEANADEKVMSTMISVSTVEENAERRVRMAKRYYREVGVKEGREEGLAEGRAEGRAEAEASYSVLVELLLADGRQDDLLRAARDAAYRADLFAEYNL